MIFKSINDNLLDKDDFLEKISIYIRLVEVTAERFSLNIKISSEISTEIVSELIDMGIINSENDIALLKKILGQVFVKFISCVYCFLSNKSLFDKTLDCLSNKKRKDLQDKELASHKPTIADFFAGAGGLSCGFMQAGYKVCFANDFEDVCVRTYTFNHPELCSKKVVKGDIRNIIENIEDFINEEVDVVVGGPPCQGFSSANQQRIIDDPRNELYKYYLKAIEKICPKFVLMENVKGMLKVANQVVDDFKNIVIERKGASFSYTVGYKLLISSDFSVAQNRERLIYIAIRNDISEKFNITPNNIFEEIQANCKQNKKFTLGDALFAIKPLEAPRIKNTNEIDSDVSGKKIDTNSFIGNENEYLALINNNRPIPFLFNHKARYVNDINYQIYSLLNQGDDASDPKIADIMPYGHRLHCFKDKYFKLIADKPSRTITAHLRMDCHSHIHPYQIRAITPREAARCQSFPDDYLFLGAYLKTYMQIGNAVPCLMAKGIANVIKKYL